MATFSLRIDVACMRPRVTGSMAGGFAAAAAGTASAAASGLAFSGFGAAGSPLLDCAQAAEPRYSHNAKEK
jgi:hypothetical protein